MNFVAYNDKSSAKRGLGRKAKDLDPAQYLRQEEGKWGFDVDDEGTPVTLMAVRESIVEDTPAPKPIFPSSPFPSKPVDAPKADAELDAALHQHHEDGNDVDRSEEAQEERNSAFGSFAMNQLGAQREPVQTGTPGRRNTITKIESNRPEQNGVKRPSAGTVCAQVWDIATSLSNGDEMPREKIAKLSEVIKAAEAKGINKFTARTQYARWRVFHGITGRVGS